MQDQIIKCFRDSFDRYADMIDKAIDTCPDELWVKKAGGFVYWQQIFHTLAVVELFSLIEGEEPKQTLHGRDVILFSVVPEKAMTKAEMRALSTLMKEQAHKYIDKQSVATLTNKHERLSTALQKEMTHQGALMALSGHACYHIGSLDAVLREHGLPGVY